MLAKFTVVTAPTFGNIMENRCQHQHLFTVNTAVDTTDKRISINIIVIGKAVQHTYQHQNMGIYRITVEQVILHEPSNLPKSRQIAT